MRAADIQKANRLMTDNENLAKALQQLRGVESARVELMIGNQQLLALRSEMVYQMLDELRQRNLDQLEEMGVKP